MNLIYTSNTMMSPVTEGFQQGMFEVFGLNVFLDWY